MDKESNGAQASETCKVCEQAIVRVAGVPKALSAVKCVVCSKWICAACRKRAFTCLACKGVLCPSCQAKTPHTCAKSEALAARVPAVPLTAARVTIGDMSVDVASIRILPMSLDEEFAGKDVPEVQDSFFKKALVEWGGEYLFQRHSMRCDGGKALVLFQMKGHILGSAILLSVTDYPAPVNDRYHGAYHFDVASIHMIRPVGIDDFHRVVPEIKAFNQSKQRIPLERAETLGRFLSETAL